VALDIDKGISMLSKGTKYGQVGKSAEKRQRVPRDCEATPPYRAVAAAVLYGVVQVKTGSG
jgi:hypothetical protein